MTLNQLLSRLETLGNQIGNKTPSGDRTLDAIVVISSEKEENISNIYYDISNNKFHIILEEE